jgi:hypothetical protein
MCPGTSQQHLDELVRFLLKLAADTATDEKLKEGERQLFARQHDILSGAVQELTSLIRASAKFEHEQEHHLYKLFELLGATCVIASQGIDDKIRDRFRTSAATDRKQTIAEQTAKIIADVMKTNPHPRKTPYGNAGEIEQEVNIRLRAEKLPELKRRAIAGYLPQKQKPA